MRRLSFDQQDFETAFARFLDEPRGQPSDVAVAVSAILASVRAEGMAAVLDFTHRFDGVDLSEAGLRVSAAEIEHAVAACPSDVRAAIDFAATRITDYHQRQKPADDSWTDGAGVSLGWRWTPLDSVGLYVPGGRAAYPSTVLMNAIPAQVAGVDRVVMVTPPGRLEPAVLAAAARAGVSEVWRIGGAQSVAALAFGAGALAPVDKIVGPGNAFVTEAKRQLYGKVGIDALAGPSEIVVVADNANDPAWIAADLLSQAEHDPDAQSILICDDAGFADKVLAAIEQHLTALETAEVARQSLQSHGMVIIAPVTEFAHLVNRLAPEHVELAIADPESLSAQIRHAGAIFLGRYTPEALGDYVAGSNHVLPTSRAARFQSGLSCYDFLKRTSIVGCPAAAYAPLGVATVALAGAEGLPAHRLSAALRLG